MFKLAFWILVLILALSFFGISVREVINSPAGQANFQYVGQLIASVWHWMTAALGLTS